MGIRTVSLGVFYSQRYSSTDKLLGRSPTLEMKPLLDTLTESRWKTGVFDKDNKRPETWSTRESHWLPGYLSGNPGVDYSSTKTRVFRWSGTSRASPGFHDPYGVWTTFDVVLLRTRVSGVPCATDPSLLFETLTSTRTVGQRTGPSCGSGV